MTAGLKMLSTMFAIAALSMSALGSIVTGTPGRAEVPSLRWKSRAVKIDISSSLTRANPNIKFGSDVMEALRRSIQAWQAVADIELTTEPTEKQSVSAAGLVGDGVSLITIAQTPENVLFFSGDSDSSSAKTRIFYDRNGFITEADIVLNPFQQFSTDGTFGTFDLESTLTHEIGHLLGLRHSAVLGATMADSSARMGTFGIADVSPRTLSESDIASIRELYGAPAETTGCCARIVGKLTFRSARQLRVWAEEGRTGRVMAQAGVAADGSFILGGLSEGSYSLFWKTVDDGASSLGQLGTVSLTDGETRMLADKITLRPETVAAQFVGMNSQLAGLAVPIAGGRGLTVYIGGQGIDPASTIEFNSPYFSVAPNSVVKQDFDDAVSVVSFVVNVHPNTPPGEYTIFLTGDRGLRSCLIGGLTLDR